MIRWKIRNPSQTETAKRQEEAQMHENKIKKLLEGNKAGIGMGVFTGSPAIVEMIGLTGFDFVYIDTEHSPLLVGRELQNLIIISNSVGLGTSVRVKLNDECMIRTAFEMGVDAVVFPHCRTAADLEYAVRSAKFPPYGTRGSATDCRSAGYACEPDFSFPEYVDRCNENSLIIPLAEDPEFFDNIDEILAVPGLSAVALGPSDLALALGVKETYNLNLPEVKERFDMLYAKCKEKNIPIMGPIAPPTAETARALADKGCRLLICRNDITNFRIMLKNYHDTVYKPFKEYWASQNG